jgi:hypothetical protein
MEGGFESWPGLDELFPVAIQGVNHNLSVVRTFGAERGVD